MTWKESCVKSWYTRYECTYWLWNATRQRRGIRVELVSGGGYAMSLR